MVKTIYILEYYHQHLRKLEIVKLGNKTRQVTDHTVRKYIPYNVLGLKRDAKVNRRILKVDFRNE